MKILVISKRAIIPDHQQKFEQLAEKENYQIRLLVPRKYRDHAQRKSFSAIERRGGSFEVQITSDFNPIRMLSIAIHFYPDIIWIDDEPSKLVVSKWVFIKNMFMPYSHIICSSGVNRYAQISGFLKKFERMNYSNLDAVISTGKTVSDNLIRKKFNGNIIEIPGFDSLAFNINDDSKKMEASGLKNSLGLKSKVIAYAGPLREGRGLEWLLRSCAGIPHQVSILMLGSGPLESTLKKMAVELGLDSCLQILSRENESGVFNLLRAADVLVFPSVSDHGYREPYNRILAWAMSERIPVVGSACGEIPYQIADERAVVPEHDVQKLTELLTRMIKDEEFKNEISERAFVKYQETSSEKALTSLAEKMQSIAK